MNRMLVGVSLLLGLGVSVTRAQEFDVTAFNGMNGPGTAQGTSNGVGWTMSLTHVGETVLDGSYTGFSDPNLFSPPIQATDKVHVGAEDFTLTFDQPIATALMYIRRDGGGATIDFGMTPILVSGTLAIDGTKVSVNPNTGADGGVIRYENINSTLLTHTAFSFNGLDLAWIVSPVPEPSSVALLGISGLLMVGILQRSRRFNG